MRFVINLNYLLVRFKKFVVYLVLMKNRTLFLGAIGGLAALVIGCGETDNDKVVPDGGIIYIVPNISVPEPLPYLPNVEDSPDDNNDLVLVTISKGKEGNLIKPYNTGSQYLDSGLFCDSSYDSACN